MVESDGPARIVRGRQTALRLRLTVTTFHTVSVFGSPHVAAAMAEVIERICELSREAER